MKTQNRIRIFFFVFLLLMASGCQKEAPDSAISEKPETLRDNKAVYVTPAQVDLEASGEVIGELKEDGSSEEDESKEIEIPSPSLSEVAFTFEGNLYKGIDFSKRGNTSANINRSNLGLVTKSGEWVYYYEPVTMQLIRMKSDGSDKTLILQGDAFLYLNVVDDWIYYSNGGMGIWKVKTDGSEKTQLGLDYVSEMIVIDNYIFYLASDGPTSSKRIKRIKTDGSDAKYLSPERTLDTFYVDEKIYYSGPGDSGGRKFFCMDLNGENISEVYGDSIGSYFIHGDYVYDSKNSFIKINLKDKKEEVFIQEIFRTPSLYKDWIFYKDYYEEEEERGPKNDLYCNTATLRRVKLDGSETHLVSDIQVWHYMIVDEEWVYYFPLYEIHQVDPEVMVMRRVRWDGTDDQALTSVEMEAGSGE